MLLYTGNSTENVFKVSSRRFSKKCIKCKPQRRLKTFRIYQKIHLPGQIENYCTFAAVG